MIGRLASFDHAVIALFVAANFLLEPSRAFSGIAWEGPKMGGGITMIRWWGVAFVLISACLFLTARNHLQPKLYQVVLGAEGIAYAIIGVGFTKQATIPNVPISLFPAILCLLAVMSVFHTIVSLDPRTKDTP